MTDSGTEQDSAERSDVYGWWRWWHLLPMVALGAQAVLHSPAPWGVFENAGRAFGAGIIVPLAAGAYRWAVAKLGGYFYIPSRVWLVASVLALPTVLVNRYWLAAIVLAPSVRVLDHLRTEGNRNKESEGEEATISG